jgi:hypothetical protein
MAFNPFASFRKYQKFWMATVLLLCMITFVLCTGVGGDLSQRLLDLFRPRQGKVFAKLDGRSIYEDEMIALKRQRDTADEFMKRATKTALSRAQARIKEQSEKPEGGKEGQMRKVILTRLEAVKNELQLRLARPRYFEGSAKFEDVLDFAMWRRVADRLDIDFLPETVQRMIDLEVFAVVPLGARNGIGLFDRGDILNIQRDLRSNFQNATSAGIYHAIRDEFRVRTAQLCLVLAQPRVYKARDSREDPSLRELFQEFKLKNVLKPDLGSPDEVRMPLAPTQMWDIFQQKLSQFDIALVPVPVEKFLDKIPEPTDGELQVFFDDNKKTPYDPASAKPGFMIPAQVKVEWIMADPESAYYQGIAKTVTKLEALEVLPPIGWSPVYPQLVAACRYGAGPLAFRAYLARNYEELKKDFRRDSYVAAPLSEPSLPALLSHLSKPTPAAVASMIAAGAAEPVAAPTASYRAHQYKLHAKELEPLVAAENEARLKFFAPLPGLAATPLFSPLTVAGALVQADASERFLPLGAVEAELKKQRETKLAHDQVRANMSVVKEELEKKSGKAIALNLAVRSFIPKFGLQHAETKAFHDQFNISKAPELAPLRESFEKYRFLVNSAEGRGGKEERLKEDDFPRLFFDAGEPAFSVAVGRYIPKAWPPVVEVKSNDPNTPPRTESFFETAEKPFLFWKTADLDSRTPENLKEVRDKVVRAWKMQKAREKFALAQARQIATQLQKSAAGTYGTVVREQAAKLGVAPIYIPEVAELVRSTADFRKTYHEFTPPKDGFEYPRDDLAKQLLALTKLDKAEKALETARPDPLNKKDGTGTKAGVNLETAYPELDTLNTELLKGKAVQQIQVLTNKPQNTFYVAVVTQALGANMGEFAETLKQARGFAPDLFLEIAQESAGKEFRQALTAQLRQQMNRSVEADAETIKSFDANVN